MGMCWAPDCKHYNARETCRFFRFPKFGKERARWKGLLRRDCEPGPGAFVCSCHFREGKKQNGPELFLQNVARRSKFQAKTSEKKVKKKKTPRKKLPLSEEPQELGPPRAKILTPPPSTSKEEIEPRTKVTNNLLEAEANFLKQDAEKLKEQLQYISINFCYDNIKNNDKFIVFYTGLPNSKIFESLHNLIKDVELEYYLGWKMVKLSQIDQLLLTLMKVRLNCPHKDLSRRFNISRAAISHVFLTNVQVLHEVLYKRMMATISSRQKNKTCTNCRVAIDCTEILTVRRKSMKNQSTHNRRKTFKGLVGVAPNGVITYVSELYVGSTTDQKIVEDCGFLKRLEVGDDLLADEGFLLQNILPPGVSLNIKCTPKQVNCTETVACDRIHVERAIRRMKCYRILSLIPESLCSFANVIFCTTAALTNLQYPLVKEVGELFSSVIDE